MTTVILMLGHYAGTFLYNTNNTQNYNFGVSRVNDYLFDYAVYARSDTTGILSQQYIMAQGGFKSFVTPSESNQWLATTNLSYSYYGIGWMPMPILVL